MEDARSAQPPEGYQPYAELDLCSNALIDVLIPFEVAGFPVLLIGEGPAPLVWLGAPLDAKGSGWDYVVRANRSSNALITVRSHPASKSTTVQVAGRTVLFVVSSEPHKAVLGELDLRPLGLNVQGDPTSLRVANTTLQHNTLQNLRVAIALGGPGPATAEVQQAGH